jgi:ferrous iron transport protein B
MKHHVIGIVGNPNCGKTTLFNALTGTRQRVGNWPGVTVERKSGAFAHAGKTFEVVDLPGVYSLSAASLDEAVARDYILSGQADLIVNIVDAANLERNLYLTIQLLEMRVPLIVALNMMDIAEDQGLAIDLPLLSRRLGCPVVPLVAARKKGLDKLRAEIDHHAQSRSISDIQVAYPPEIRRALETLMPLAGAAAELKTDPRYLAVKLLEGDPWAAGLVDAEVVQTCQRLRQTISDELDEEVDILMADARYGLIDWITRETAKNEKPAGRLLSDGIDRLVLNRALGIPVFLLAMYLMFMLTINIGGAFIDFFDILAGTIFVDGFARILAALGSPDWLTAILADGIGGGLQTIATFIPPIGFMFLCLCFLEDSGYMARAAFVMDRFMRVIGLPGKAFVPMLVGFGCNVPAIMATRILENRRDRILTIMMNPFMSCGARLPVYALFAAAFFPTGGQNLVFGLYLTGIGFAVITGLILKRTLLAGSITPFVMELPPYHLPTVNGVLLRAWDRLKTFIFRAGKVILPVVAILSFLNSLGTDGSFGNQDSENSVLSAVGRTITPVFAPMGLTRENWPATVGIFTGVFAKEAVVGTLDAMYSRMGEGENGASAREPFDFAGGIKAAFVSIPDNLAGVAGVLGDPLGLSVGDVSTAEVAAEEQAVAVGTFGAMTRLFDGRIGAFAYLLFILLYFPCVAAIAAVYRETNLMWTVFIGAWTSGLAYMASVLFYQTATFDRHPVSSLLWIATVGLVFFGVVLIMRRTNGQSDKSASVLTTGGALA